MSFRWTLLQLVQDFDIEEWPVMLPEHEIKNKKKRMNEWKSRELVNTLGWRFFINIKINHKAILRFKNSNLNDLNTCMISWSPDQCNERYQIYCNIKSEQ